jgi:hypothetical protein
MKSCPWTKYERPTHMYCQRLHNQDRSLRYCEFQICYQQFADQDVYPALNSERLEVRKVLLLPKNRLIRRHFQVSAILNIRSICRITDGMDPISIGESTCDQIGTGNIQQHFDLILSLSILPRLMRSRFFLTFLSHPCLNFL